MPRAFLTPFVIAGLLFLPSCSSAEAEKAKACEMAVSLSRFYFAKYEAYFMGFKTELAAELEKSGKGVTPKIESLIKESTESREKSWQIIVNNQSCFTPDKVLQAQDGLANK